MNPSEGKSELTWSTESDLVKPVLYGCIGVWDGFGVLFEIGI